ncbi:MAG: L-seryl-tRNA(Sec) selenium transferase, partial [Candidatus Eremiobacteraeota bacterium]|nr:L-seryl-tRNA(Sec) selenium transferase [Candidatus Eremiobacteraeota bacterium]
MSRFLAEPDVAAYANLYGTTVVKATVDAVLSDVRRAAVRERCDVPAFDDLLMRTRRQLANVELGELVGVLNGTGILLHTNLGRAPLARVALEAMTSVAGGYSNLEFDVEAGTRGSRYSRVSTLLRETTGASDSLVVNNCAAAVLLILDTFGKGREVVVSRNQLIEIGGGFRLPDVLARSGATLVEVGATNKVYLRDFERALSANTALLLRSHTSNYRIEGFTSDVEPAELAALGRRVGVTTVEDLGGGALVDLAPYGLPHERTVREAVADGIDLVAFSGDKLLGGPQCGVVVGAAAAIARMRANPLLRALRVDKATLAALAATLRLYLHERDLEQIPFYEMLARTRDDLMLRANDLAAAVGTGFAARDSAGRPSVRPVATDAYAGGGSAPLAALPSYGIALRRDGTSPNALAARLRTAPPRLIGRVDGDEVVIDLRAIPAS